MEALGHPVTWPTSCFIGNGCGAPVFGHTNGHGDFVLLDALGFPWPVHECYARRFEISTNATSVRIKATKEVWCALPDLSGLRNHHGKRVEATREHYWEELDIVATVTNVEDSLLAAGSRPRYISPEIKSKLYDQIHRCRASVTFYTGEGHEYLALVDLNVHRLKFNDLIAATLKVKPVLDEYAFFVVRAKRFRPT
jgi:hypothetical protein